MICPNRSIPCAEQPIDAPRVFAERLAASSCRACADAAGRPGSCRPCAPARRVSTTTRVPRNTASEMPWVTNRIVLPRLLPDAQQFEVHLLARQRVERAERLVHQDRASGRGRARARSRRAAACRRRARRDICPRAPCSPTSASRSRARSRLSRSRQAEDFGRQQHVVDDAAPFQQQRLLEHHADVARRIERLRWRADPHLAAVVRVQAGEDFQQRGLAAAGGADQRHKLAGIDVEASPRRSPGTPPRACGRLS